MEKELGKQIGNILKTVRSKKPLIHHITNYVTVNDCANITLAIGASPIMADDIGEAEAITSISSLVPVRRSCETGRSTAEAVAKKFGCVAAITGATDILSDGRRTMLLNNGTKLLCDVTCTGCMCTSLVGSFCGASEDYRLAAAEGVLCMSIAGEIAAEKSGELGNGSFHSGRDAGLWCL